jgi:uncharacterized repeat protein (TIGR01451 family)
MTPVAPAASGSARHALSFDPAPAPAATVVTATKTDSFDDPDGDGKAEPGQTITYEVNISNTGAADATGVQFADTIDPNTTLVGGSLRVSPLAYADSYNATVNTPLSIAAPGVLSNDTGTPAPAAQPIAAGATAQGGTVTLNADGSFTYTPPSATFEGADTFGYTVTNGTTPNDTATVTINVDKGPAVTTTSPADGANGVAQNSNITVNFTEPVNATTGSFSLQCPAGSPQTFTLSASPSASFTLDPTADLPAGATCAVTVTASGITDADSYDPPDQMAADHVFSFGVKPLAVDDMRSATGNVRIDTAANGYSILANDQAPGATITAYDATSANGGQVAVNTSTGTFTYNPPRGFTGTDSFNYTIGNGGGSDTGTVVLTVTDIIWFIDNAPGACSSSCDGRLTNPYTSLADFEADNGSVGAGNPKAGDNIFIYTGGGPYTAPVTLESGQVVVGQGATGALTGLGSLTGVTPAPDSDPLPSTGGTKPSVTSAGNGFNLAANNELYGVAFDDTAGAAVTSTVNVGTLVIGDVAINNDGSDGAGLVLDDGGTVTSTGTNSINARSAVALSLTNATSIGAGNLTFRSISAGNNDASADPASGIVLNNTGAAGGLVVTGDAGGANNASGGTIQRTTGDGVSLTNAQNVSLDQLSIQNTLGSGVGGTQVTNFSLTNSTVNAAGNALEESAVAFNTSKTTANNIAGTLVVTGNTITNSFYSGLDVQAGDGTVTNADVSNNVITTTANGFGINFVGTCTAANTCFRLDNADINQNSISGVRAAGIQVQVSSNGAGTGVPHAGLPGDASKRIRITNNSILPLTTGTQAIAVVTSGLNSAARAKMNFLIECNGKNTGGCTSPTAAGIGSSNAGHVILIGNNGHSDMAGVINNNVIAATHTSFSGGSGISGGNGTSGAGNLWTPNLTLSVTNNTISGTDNSGILLVGRGTSGFAGLKVANNNVAAPKSGTRSGIRVDAGNTASADDAICLDIAGNTSGASGSAGAIPGISIRKQGTNAAVNDFGIAGLSPSPATGAQAEDYVASLNPGSALGTSSDTVTQKRAISLSGSNYVSCVSTIAAATAAPSGPASAETASAEPRVWSDMKSGGEAGEAEEASVTDAGDRGATYFGARIVSASYERPSAARARRNSAPVGDAVKTASDVEEKATVETARASALPAAPFSGGDTVNVNVGTLRAGKTVRIVFEVTVNNPFTGSQPQVSNQGTVTGDNFSAVQTQDTGGGPTVTPILTPPSISISDASVVEPGSGSAQATFAVTLSHAYTHPVQVNFATADGGANPATAGSDYTAASGTLTFNPGQTVQTVPVSALADADAAEAVETFLVDLSGATGGATISDAQAVGTIMPDSTVLISELRTSGPLGADDEFVELYNNTDSPITVAASDGSAGWALVKSGNDCTATPVVVAVIPAGTVIPARGNYLLTGATYSLGAYAAGDQALLFGIEDDRNVALFNTANVANPSAGTRLDAVGFGANAGDNCDLLREGSTLAPAQGSTSQHAFVRKVDRGATQDTSDNAADFVVVSTSGGAVGLNASSRLGAPGPENATGARGPVPCNVTSAPEFGRDRLDSTAALGSSPNTVRGAAAVPNGTNGTIEFRRRFTNNTGGDVTQLRFRITNLKSTPGAADLRALSSPDVAVTTGGGPVAVSGTTLEQPPAQASGGGVNSTLGVGTVTLAAPLADGASVNLRLLFGVQQAGDYHVSIVVEAATAGRIGQDVWELRGNTEGTNHTEGSCNTPPVAEAGDDKTIECGGGSTPVSLDGSASTDADGDTLAYEWREGAAVLGTSAQLDTTLAFGSHTITLKVTDPSGDFDEDEVVVQVVDTAAPTVDAPENVTFYTGPGATSCGVYVGDEDLGTATAADGCNPSVTITRTGVPAGNFFPVGTTVVTYTADDGHGHTASAQQVVTVIDNTVPTVTAPANVEVNAPPNSCSVSLDPGTASAGDNCAGVGVVGTRSDSKPLNAPYPVGVTTITWTATDASGNTASATQTVKVNDVTAPAITLTTGAINLSPPNHQYQTFSVSDFVASVSDSCDASVDINDVVVSQATSDEPENASGNGDGNTVNDIVIAPDCKSLQLRREREGGGNGRVYSITLKVKDSSGNVATAVRKVFVPRSGPAVEDGAQYGVSGCAP